VGELFDQLKDIVCCKEVESGLSGGFVAQHGVGLARPSLAIGETGRFELFEGGLDERLHTELVNLVVGLGLVKGLVEGELVRLGVLGQVDLEPT
jgi:hypothetical protein